MANSLERGLNISLEDRIQTNAERDLERAPISAALRLGAFGEPDFNPAVETRFLAKHQSRVE